MHGSIQINIMIKVHEPKGMQNTGADIRVIKNMVGEIGATISRQSSSLKSVLLTF